MPSIDAVFHFTCATTHPQLPSHQWCPACSRPCCSLIRASLHFASEPGFLSSDARHPMDWWIETMKPPSIPIFVEKVRHIRMLKKWINPNFMVHELHEPSIFMWLNHVESPFFGASPMHCLQPSRWVDQQGDFSIGRSNLGGLARWFQTGPCKPKLVISSMGIPGS